MTDQQIREQLRRLSIFGNLDDVEFQGYAQALQHTGYTELVNGVTELISTYERSRFPLPVEIIRACKDVAVRSVEQRQATQREQEYDCGSMAATSAHAAAFRLVWYIEDAAMRQHFWQKRLQVNENASTEHQVAHYNQVKQEIEGYLRSINVSYTETKGCDLVPVMAGDEKEEYPF